MIIEESLLEYLTTFMEHKDTSPQVQNVELQNLIRSYEKYNADTLEGKYNGAILRDVYRLCKSLPHVY